MVEYLPSRMSDKIMSGVLFVAVPDQMSDFLPYRISVSFLKWHGGSHSKQSNCCSFFVVLCWTNPKPAEIQCWIQHELVPRGLAPRQKIYPLSKVASCPQTCVHSNYLGQVTIAHVCCAIFGHILLLGVDSPKASRNPFELCLKDFVRLPCSRYSIWVILAPRLSCHQVVVYVVFISSILWIFENGCWTADIEGLSCAVGFCRGCQGDAFGCVDSGGLRKFTELSAEVGLRRI